MESGDVAWFDAVMLRGLIALYRIDGEAEYLDAVSRTLDYAWRNGRDKDGLFGKYLSRTGREPRRWLLTQAAYAGMSLLCKVDLE